MNLASTLINFLTKRNNHSTPEFPTVEFRDDRLQKGEKRVQSGKIQRFIQRYFSILDSSYMFIRENFFFFICLTGITCDMRYKLSFVGITDEIMIQYIAIIITTISYQIIIIEFLNLLI